jgi:uncharacterized membrane protein
MKKDRLEAFSDGVIAIIITIMVLEFKLPHGNAAHPSNDIHALIPLLPVFLSYVLSFIYVGIYWNNHHHMIYAVSSINGKVLWANLNLLFWLSLVPFVTGWMGESHFSMWPVFAYGCVLLMNSVAYFILARLLVKQAGPDSALARAMGKDWKGKLSTIIYAVAIAVSPYCSWVSLGLYWVVAVIWFIPDTRIEKKVADKAH